MKRILLIIVLLTSGTLLLQSCYKDIISPGSDPNGPPQNVSFSGDVQPIFDKNCNNSGCHDGVPTKKPSLIGSKSYNDLLNGGYVNTISPANSPIYTVIKGGSMPPSGAIKSADQQKILDWIRNGAPNN